MWRSTDEMGNRIYQGSSAGHEKLDPQSRKYVLKAIDKVSANPLPNAEGRYGKPLGNHRTAKLSGYVKIKLKDLGLSLCPFVTMTRSIEAASRIKKLEEEK